MHGTWKTEGGGGGFPAGLLALVALIIIGGGVAEGVAQAVASLVTVLLIAAAAVIVLAVAVAAALVMHRVRHPALAQLRPVREMTAKVSPPMIVNNFYGGTHIHALPGAGAEVIRQALPDREAVITRED